MSSCDISVTFPQIGYRVVKQQAWEMGLVHRNVHSGLNLTFLEGRAQNSKYEIAYRFNGTDNNAKV